MIPVTHPARRATPAGRARAGRWFGLAALLPLLAGCSSLELFNPMGSIAEQEMQLILVCTGLMLLVVVPVIILTLYFAWRYRASNTQATYAPDWSHSTAIEVVIWTIPCLIIVVLAVLIWNSTHALDPYRPIASDKAPLRVEVVALNWKWLFIYPDHNVATVNELVMPVDTPVAFKLTSESMMNAFFVPQLGSMVYTMAGMQTRLHLIGHTPGTYAGMSSAYSGSGFSDMKFPARVVTEDDFSAWLAQARSSGAHLDAARLSELEVPTHGAPLQRFSGVDTGLFDRIVGRYHGMGDDEICLPGEQPGATSKTSSLVASASRTAEN
ncbi:ubiquinol oxidase subunit II [Stenotrophomonas rhizophila]|uniref:ubiquinol oxidase subunit II n=1 Tax=Stenotrophomonas rhizophila TaxID=216778 RepID=UPI00226C3665|nr:ubiquinol oxidase subunit II [Stenotrophomonas rhizophila]MCC7633909.1 ubiquinol oxidase subunit II [Stenotrophomonas rhizophila]MCC7663243.1 ubiquinol oxidase subunit II [Stenotrophomonas rhizophila]